jgi:outer membrane protein
MSIRAALLAFFFLVYLQLSAQEQIPLEQIIAMALEKNYDVQLAKNLEASADTDHDYVKGAFLPVINANGTKLWNTVDQRQKLSDGTLRESDNVKSETLNANVQLTWTLFDGTKMFALRDRVAQIEAQSSFIVKDQMVNTIALVIVNYYDVVRQKQQQMAIEELMSVNEERVKLAERKLEVGVGARPELLQAKVDLNAQRTAILQQETRIAQLKKLLNGLTGNQLPQEFDVADTIVLDLDLKQTEIENNVLTTNYGLLAAKDGIEISRLSLRERRAEKFPLVNFVSAYNFNRVENSMAVSQISPLLNQNKGINFGFTVSLPILNGFNNRRLVQQARLSLSRSEVLYNQSVLDVNVAVQNAFTEYDNARKVLIIEEENILLAKENVSIALESFKRGVATFIELRTAQQSLAEAYSRLINARYLAKVAETQLLRLQGALLR